MTVGWVEDLAVHASTAVAQNAAGRERAGGGRDSDVTVLRGSSFGSLAVLQQIGLHDRVSWFRVRAEARAPVVSVTMASPATIATSARLNVGRNVDAIQSTTA